MTRNYNRSEVLNYFDLSDEQKKEVFDNYFSTIEEAEEDFYVISEFKDKEEAIPLSCFLKTHQNNFTHGIYSDSYFSGYFLTFSKCNTEAVIAYKYF
jgi:hypothetical protein